MELLDAPAVVDKAVGQIVQQFAVRRTIAHQTEIGGRAHQAATEMVMPYPVHHHPRGERVLGTGEPFRERGAPTALTGRGRRNGRVTRVQDRQEPGLHFCLGRIVSAPTQDMGFGHGRGIFHHRLGDRQLGRLQMVEGLQLSLELRVSRLRLALQTLRYFTIIEGQSR